jgi:Asp-tRNA(Asn)/Glu-tRNA(Gln) amidotransferase A subunit family amidase
MPFIDPALARLSLRDMAAGVANGSFTAAALVQAHLERIESLNPKINAFVRLLAEDAMREAASPRPGPLGGVPVTVKDSFDLAGYPTLCGSRFRLGHIAPDDATAVARLKSAGAIILGKTNCPEFLANYETDNHLAGRTNNPWDPDRTPGGSSGGEAAAISSCMSPGGIGSDGGGSIRLPAHFCGIAGLKPTPGRVPATGHYPAIHHPGGLLGVAGPMARSVADVRLLYEVLAGHDDADPFSAPVPPYTPPADGICVGVMEQFGAVPVDRRARDAVLTAAELLRAHRFDVAAFAPSGLEKAPNLWSFFFSDLAVPFTREIIAGREDEAHWTGVEFYNLLKDRPEPTGKQVVENLAARDAMRAVLLAQMRSVPVILSPVCATAAFTHRQRRFETGEKQIGLFQANMPLTWVNLLGLPSLVLPVGKTPDGLPVGVQLIGRPWEEERLLAIGEQLERARGPFELP